MSYTTGPSPVRLYANLAIGLALLSSIIMGLLTWSIIILTLAVVIMGIIVILHRESIK